MMHKTSKINDTLRALMIATTALTVALSIGCGQDSDGDDPTVTCGQGESVQVDGATMCVYQQAVVIENGFSCPATVPNLHVHEPLATCAPTKELPPEKIEVIEEQIVDQNPTLAPGVCSSAQDPSTACPSAQRCFNRRCKLDTDGDGIDDANDNCVNVVNADQTDTDNNGIGDACETDGCMADDQCAQGQVCESMVCQAALACRTTPDCSNFPNRTCQQGFCL